MNLPYRVVDTKTGTILDSNEAIINPAGKIVRVYLHSIRQGDAVWLFNHKVNDLIVQYRASISTDKDGNELWEGDIVDCFRYGRREIVWSNKDAAFILRSEGATSTTKGILLHVINSTSITRVGNVLFKDSKKAAISDI